MRKLNEMIDSYRGYGLLITRVILGVLFILHGLDKFDTGLDNVEGFFDSQGVPLPGLSTPLVAVLEIILGGALVLGFVTRYAALILGVIILGAIIFVDKEQIIGGTELDLAYLSGLSALMFNGGGAFSGDQMVKFENGKLETVN